MAKISAHGSYEVARRVTEYGATYVLTNDGRILRKSAGSPTFNVIGRRVLWILSGPEVALGRWMYAHGYAENPS